MFAQVPPSLTTDKPCYVEGSTVQFHGAGYTPGANFFLEAISVYQRGTVGADGTFNAQAAAPLNTAENTSAATKTVNGYQENPGGTNDVLAKAAFKVVSFLVRPKNDAGYPRDFTKWGFSGFTPGRKIYFHVTRGRHVWTQKAGRGSKPCGILHTRLRKLPAVPAGAIHSGTYRVYVDNRRHFHKGARHVSYPYQVY